MTENDICNSLLAILDDVAPSVEMSADKSDQNLGDIGYDSLDQSSFVLGIEEAFSVPISDEELENLTTLNQFVSFIAAKID